MIRVDATTNPYQPYHHQPIPTYAPQYEQYPHQPPQHIPHYPVHHEVPQIIHSPPVHPPQPVLHHSPPVHPPQPVLHHPPQFQHHPPQVQHQPDHGVIPSVYPPTGPHLPDYYKGQAVHGPPQAIVADSPYGSKKEQVFPALVRGNCNTFSFKDNHLILK